MDIEEIYGEKCSGEPVIVPLSTEDALEILSE